MQFSFVHVTWFVVYWLSAPRLRWCNSCNYRSNCTWHMQISQLSSKSRMQLHVQLIKLCEALFFDVCVCLLLWFLGSVSVKLIRKTRSSFLVVTMFKDWAAARQYICHLWHSPTGIWSILNSFSIHQVISVTSWNRLILCNIMNSAV